MVQTTIHVIPESYLNLEIPYYESVVAGFPSPAEDYIEQSLDLNEYLIKDPAATFFVRVEGNSMINAGIFPNDILIVDRSLEPRHNQIIIGIIDGEFTVKRLCIQGLKVLLKAENTAFEAIEITRDTDFRVWGVVTNVVHQF